MPTTITAVPTTLEIDTDPGVLTAIERFTPSGSGPASSEGDDATVLHEPTHTRSTADRPEVHRAATYLRGTLRQVPGFGGGLLLAGQAGEVALYSRWAVADSASAELPAAWSLAPALADLTRVDARTFAVDFTAPGAVSRASRTATPRAHFGVFTVAPERQEELLERARRHAPGSIGTPGLAAITFHRSLDGERVINLGLWSGFDEFGDLLARPGFVGGAEYWEGVAGFRPQFFDVVDIVGR
ncbi:hypothetical protein [Actinomycetospora termitidis]|uniref:Antibiotic biosynthesis monooxygenase n=1 Tax=Actinomycetospora termitidis TaxID=3053470 RepID=A0ABT7MDP3_9PSEU|nr:hypothetical protein [Actinomycetospora sp. Odt1-22]MDL5158790.1 hypothetical protein [Actinomycetospora sp. Odt1-22]